MEKREFLAGSAALAAAAAFPVGMALTTTAHAQAALKAGKDYKKITPPQRTQAPAGKIEVIEFFWIACGHCFQLEPVINDWAKKLPADVQFRRVHVNFRGDTHQRLYYTLVSMKEEERLLGKAFEAIHVSKSSMLNKDADVMAWASANGLNNEAFRKAYKSFGVKTQMNKASEEISAYGVQGVPALAVNGKYMTAPSMVGSNEAALKVVDQLIAMERKGG